MSDFFIPTQNKDDYWTKKQQETQTTLPQQNTQNDYWGQRSQVLQQQKEERLANYNRYGVDVPDEYYEQFNKIISQVEDPQQAQEEAYRIGSAIKYSQMYGMDLGEAYSKVDALNEANFTDLQDQKSRFEALSDMFNLGTNNVKLGQLGQQLMVANATGDTELAQNLMAQIDAINQENVLMQDNAPRSWVMQALEAGAQSLPFTGYVAAAGVFGNFIAPGAGTGAAFAASSYLSAGQEYLDMLANGASHNTAAAVATVSGAIQGLIEADLGITNGIVKGTAKLMGKEAAEKAAKVSLEEIGKKVAKRFHFGAGKKVLVNYLEQYGKNVLGEGVEEFLQEITSIVGQEVAASLDGYDILDDDFNSIVKQTTEAFKGGVLGALAMGFIPAGINAAADVKSYKFIKDTAEEYESGEMFKEAVKDSPVFEGMSDTQKADVIQEVWEKAQQRKEADVELEARQIAETRDAAEGAEEMAEAEEGEETQAQSVARDESGRLYTNDDGNTFLVGDATKDDANRYGYIKYSTDENGDITIDTFKMTEGREGLREELFDEFAREHPDVNINWNAVGSEAQAMRQSLIDANPSGAKNGLNYYSSQDLDQVAARKKVAAEVRKNIHNVTKNVDGSYTRTDLNNKQVAAAVTLIESAAKRMNMSLSDYVSKTFGNQIFGSREQFAQSALAQGEQIADKAGGMNQGVAQANWKQVGQQIKAVIYAGENADFSTWAHEMAHVFQNQLDGDLKTDAETAFNVVNGDWINSKYTFSDGRTMSSAEAFAYGFQDWLETGHAESQQMQNIFQKFAQFIADAYNKLRKHLNFTPEIESVFNKLLDGDDTIMSKALKAAQEEENEYRAILKRKAEEAEATKKAEAEEAQKQAELEKEEAGEYTDYEQETTEQSAEEIEQQLEEGNEKETGNAIDDALENLNISDEQKTQTAEVLKDETSTIAEKADVIVDAAGEQFDLFQKQEGLLYQLAGEPSIRRMAESEEKRRILADLDAANELEKTKYKDYSAEGKALRIRMATGWERDANGQWKYELDDSINRIKTEVFKKNPELLTEKSASILLNLGDIYDAPQLYKVFPYMKAVRVSFYSDPNAFRAVLTPQGIKVNLRYLEGVNGEKGLKGVLAHEIQHVIQAMEYAESTGLQGADIEQLYNDMMDAMQAAGDKKYDYDITSLQEGLDAYMKDAGEIEARNVARRILMNPDKRRNTTLASTEDVKRPPKLLFQAVKNEIKADEMEGLKEITDDEFAKIADNLYSASIDYKSIPNLVLLPNVSESLKKGLGIKGNLYITKNRITHTNPKRKHAHGEQDFRLDEYKSIPKMIRNATYALQENNSKYNSFFITELDKQDNTKVNVIIFDEDKNGNLLTTIKKLPLTDLRSGSYKIVGTGVEPAISHTLRVSPTALASSPNISNNTTLKSSLSNILFQEERDDEYKQAVESGDTEKAMQMLAEEAERKGYTSNSDYQGTSAFNGAAPYRNGYFDTKEKRLQAIKDEEFEDTETLGDFAYDNADALGFDYLINDPRAYRAADDKRKEAIDNLRKAIEEAKSGKKNVTIKMYRSVPADIKEGSFRNGDWITPSKSYAEDNADVHSWGPGEYRIIEQDVDLEHIWWDGNDIAEWGYDDEKEAVYKNTENNRKLFEITYDENGDLIPLSKRFDENNPSILYQIAGEIGAQNLDDAETQEGVSRMQNLAIAKEMEEAGKDAQEIRLATAWEKGDDGLWRYELDDSKVTIDVYGGMKAWERFHPEYRELTEKLYRGEELTEKEQDRLEELSEVYYLKQEKRAEEKHFMLEDVLDFPELFKAYPTLQGVDVYIEPSTGDGTQGEYRPDEEAITLYRNPNMALTDWEKQAKSVLLHEVQHAIQQIEGFAKGGNIDTAGDIIAAENTKKAEIKDKAFAWEWKIELEAQEKKHPELRGNLALMNSLIDEYTEDGKFTVKELEEEHWLPTRDIRDKGFNLYVRGYDNAGFEDAYKEWQETASKKGLDYYDAIKDTDRNRYRYYKRFAGEVESRNVQARLNYSPEERLLSLIKSTEDVAPEDKIILFQAAYHGSGASFDKFDTETYGLSGEGSMSFGYGTYLTDSENIAKDYAQRAKERILEEEYQQARQAMNWAMESGNAARVDEIREIIKQLDEKKAGNLYKVEIPDDGYLDYEKKLSEEERQRIIEKLKIQNPYAVSASGRIRNEDLMDFNGITGSGMYEALVSFYKNNSKAVSRFLNSIGYAGIKYPAGTIHGNGNGAYNYVIFNDDDAKIIDHLLFQTNAELMQEAQGFESWQDFMEFCEVMHSDDEVSPIPSEADAQWYQSFWETAHGLQTEQEKNEQTLQEKNEKDTTVAKAMDALFVIYIRSNPEMLDDFLHEVARLDEIDLNSDEWRNVEDDMQAAERDKIDTLKDAIAITMSDYNWQSAMRRIQGGGEISEGMRKRLLGEMTDSFKTRDFRALYAEVMEDAQYAVDEADTTSAMLSKKLQKYNKRYYDIVKPGEDISKMSPEKRKRIAEAMANRDIANKIRNGSLKLDDELDAYIKSLDSQIKEKQKQFDELEKETKADYQRIADAERRRLLKLHDELLIARSKLTQKNSDTARKINKGLKITEKYRRESQNLQANYDELFRKFNDLKNTIQITAEVQAALDRQEQVASVREDLNAKQKEKNLTAEVKKMRINLVKRTMRRVPFNRIDYDNAKTVIAIQRMLEPNLIGGVNKFIGIDSPFLRGVISQIVTDSDYKEKILRYLDKNSRSSEAFVNFKKKLSEMKSIKDFDRWTAKERKAAIKYLPKENWVKDLNLMELAKEREESIDLDIDTEEYSRQAYDENGKPKTYKDADGIEQNVYETAFRLRYSDELGQLVKDAVGADMFDRIVNRPFSEWTTEELEQLAQRIDELYTEGRDLLAAKNEARKREAEAIRKRVEDAIKDTGIVINEDDPPEEKERKQKEINKVLNLNSGLKGTEAGKDKGIKAKLDRLLHGYSDMNMLRFARMLDNQSEGENVYMLYRREDDCYNAKTRSINNRARAINEIMKANNITEGDLAQSIRVDSLNTEFTVDELLYFLAADKDYAEDETKLAKGLFGIDANDDWAATSRNAVMFGNMMSDTASQEQKEAWAELDKQMQDAISNDTLTPEQKQLKAMGQLDEHPGTSAYINYCHAKWETVLGAANSFIAEHPEYKALMEAIEADYAAQYERMNEVSINEFNMPVHRVRAYVPLVRRESNGDTNVNQVKEDLLGAYGADAGKQWVNRGMTQRRVNISPLNQKPVQTGLFATWGSSVDRTEHFIAYAPYVRQLNAIYKSRDASYTRRFIESRYGKGAVQYLDNYINEVANPNAGKVREAGAEWLHTFRGRTAPAYLGWKFSAIIKQGLTSPWPYMQFVNPAEYASAALECTRKGTYDAIREKSVFMNNRVMDPMNELIEEMAEEGKTKFDRALGKFGKKGMAGLEWIDWVCVAPGWLACYKKEYARLQRASEARYDAKMEELRERNMYAEVGTSEYMTPDQMEAQARKEIMEDIETEAVRYADDCTRQCQPSSRAADLAPLFKNSSEAMKAFLQFQTSLNVIWQNIRYDMPYAVRNKQFQRIAGTIMGYVFAGIFMNSVMDGVTSGADDDDDKDLQALRNLVFYSTTQFTDAIPIMGSEITNMMDQVITGKRGFAQSGTDMTPSATKLLSALTNASKGNWEKAATLSAEAIGMAAGAPISGIKEINKLLGKPLEEGDVNLLRGLSDVYGIAGDIIEE